MQGPLEGSRGILEGTGSLFKNTIKGTFGSTSKITSSISKGILALTNVMFPCTMVSNFERMVITLTREKKDKFKNDQRTWWME